MPVLGGVRLSVTGDALQVTGTDLDLTITVETTVSGASDGVVVAPGRLVTDIVRALDTAGVEVDDIVVRHPSLDDVFHVLTRPAGAEAAA